MIRINQFKLKIGHNNEELKKKLLRELKIRPEELLSYKIRKRSIDARKKPELYFVYTIDIETTKEKQILKQKKNNIQPINEVKYQIPKRQKTSPRKRPVVIGSGPAGLFCTYLLALAGYAPILLERGTPVEKRIKDVEEFWKTGMLKKNSNVQFGEGGAGTFSDGKLNTLVKDSSGRNTFVLETLVKFGASKEILYEQKPHIGTDILIDVVQNMRSAMLELGAEVRFHSQVTDVVFEYTDSGYEKERRICGVIINGEEKLDTDTVVLAIGHSARDTFEMLYEKELEIQAKSFAVGVRVEHPQKKINLSQYGSEEVEGLSAAPYKLTEKLENGRGIYSFCMCPGGYVVNASSEEHCLAINGMSYSKRDGENANSAIIVTVTPEDFGSLHPLAGIAFQRELERKAYEVGNGKIPVQRYEDFCENRASSSFGSVSPQMKGEFVFGNVRSIFPEVLAESIQEGIQKFGKKIQGFADKDTLLSGVESRTSSPVRIPRDQQMEGVIAGLYPCGEGAGYAGGITSAAMDGLKVAEAIIQKYQIQDTETS